MHQVELILRAHLMDPKKTERSIGLLYGLCIAAQPPFGDDDWPRLNKLIIDTFKNPKKWVHKLDRIKKHGWDLHSAVCELQSDIAKET